MFERLPLKDIHLPDPVSWWPPAVGWWLLLGAVVVLGLLVRPAARAVRRMRARRRLCRQALDELAHLRRELEAGGDTGRTLERLSVLLRRVALSVFPAPGIAGRTGRAWVDWLRRTGPDGLDPAALEPLIDGPYRPDPPGAPPSLFDVAGRWIRHVTRQAS